MLKMLFLIMSNVEIDFTAWDLQWGFYITRDVFLTTRQVELIRKKKFAVVALNPEHKVFIVHIAVLSVDLGDKVYLLKKAQIVYLKADKASTKVLSKYANFVDVFSPKLAVKLSKYTRIRDYAIKLVDNQQPSYSSIYSLRPIELETLKIYIENHLASGFIRPSKSLARVLIFLNKKPDGSLRLYINYQGFNHLIIKNWYLLPLVNKLLDWLGQARHFTQLNLINAFHWI